MKTLSATEVITKSRDLLVKQGKPAINGLGGCSYRSSDGLGCAVGILLSDADAAIMDNMDEGSIDRILSLNAPVYDEMDMGLPIEDWEAYKTLSPEGRALIEAHPELLKTMQVIHDQCQGVEPEVPVSKFVPHITEQFGYLLDAQKV